GRCKARRRPGRLAARPRRDRCRGARPGELPSCCRGAGRCGRTPRRGPRHARGAPLPWTRMSSTSRTLAEWLAYIETRHPRSIELGLERVREVAARLGLQRPAAQVFTVAGTNGKGSTVAFIEAIARADGWKVGAYSSPHLLRYNER